MAVTEYIGPLVGPVFADPAEWTPTRSYEALTIVLNEGNSYTARQDVPIGVKLTNENFWLETGNYNAQVEAYRKETQHFTENIKHAILAYETITDAKNAAVKNYIGLGSVLTIADRPYVVSTASPNGMDNLMLTDTLTASLVIDKFLSPEDLQYAANAADAAPYINRCLELCRKTATVVLAHTYHIQTTIHASYADNIYTVGTAAISTDVSPAISFDVEHLSQDMRMRNPFSGNNLRIYASDRQLHNDSDFVGILLKDAEEMNISHVNIYYMGSAISIEGANNYCITIDNCLIERCFNGITINTTENSGEKFSVQNTVFGHCYRALNFNAAVNSLYLESDSFDFCCNAVYWAVNTMANQTFNNCHIEGLGYHGSDMPRIEQDSYATLVYNAAESNYLTPIVTINGGQVHVSQMEKEIGFPILVHDSTAHVFINNPPSLSCLNNNVLTTHPITTGYCEYGFGNRTASVYVGSNCTPTKVINGAYIDVADNTLTFTYREGIVDSVVGEIINIPYLTVIPCFRFIINTEFVGQTTSIRYNDLQYEDNVNGLHELRFSQPIHTLRLNGNVSGTKITIKEFYPILA